MNYADDVNALAELGWGPDQHDRLADIGFDPGAFAQFRDLDDETRALVLRLLDSPSEFDFGELAQHPAGVALAQWLLTLPAYVNAPDDDDDAGAPS